jgi:hypothetical protein
VIHIEQFVPGERPGTSKEGDENERQGEENQRSFLSFRNGRDICGGSDWLDHGRGS